MVNIKWPDKKHWRTRQLINQKLYYISDNNEKLSNNQAEVKKNNEVLCEGQKFIDFQEPNDLPVNHLFNFTNSNYRENLFKIQQNFSGIQENLYQLCYEHEISSRLNDAYSLEKYILEIIIPDNKIFSYNNKNENNFDNYNKDLINDVSEKINISNEKNKYKDIYSFERSMTRIKYF